MLLAVSKPSDEAAPGVNPGAALIAFLTFSEVSYSPTRKRVPSSWIPSYHRWALHRIWAILVHEKWGTSGTVWHNGMSRLACRTVRMVV